MNDSAQKNSAKAERQSRRSKADIGQCLHDAAVREIVQNGFVSTLLTNIIHSAKVEPQVFYNRYKDINEFYDDFVKQYDNWLNDLKATVPTPLLTREGLYDYVPKLIQGLYDNPIILEIVRWELTSKNQTTLRTAAQREMNMVSATRGFARKFKNTDINTADLFALVTGGLYFVALHSKLGPFRGLDFCSADGRKRLAEAIKKIVELMYASIDDEQTARERRAVDRLRAAGVSDDVIAQAFAT